MPTQTPYGTWNSPVSPAQLSGSMRLYDVQWSDDGQSLLWVERRPHGGTLVIQTGNDAFRDLTDSDTKISGGVGYGGGEFTTQGDHAYFVSRGRLHRVPLSGGQPQPITPQFGGAASPVVSADGQYVAFVHHYEGRDVLAVVDSDGQQWAQKIAQGDDFVMQPNWHPDGTHIAYIAWNHPQMPWNGSELRLLELSSDTDGLPHVTGEQTIAGDTETAIFQPTFSPDGSTLAYVSDATGWGHIYLYDMATGTHRQLTTGEHEHMMPGWVQNMRTFDWSANGNTITVIQQNKAFYSLWSVDVDSGEMTRIDALDDYTYLEQISVSAQNQIALIGSGTTVPTRVLMTDTHSVRVMRRATTESLSDDYLADGTPIQWTDDNGNTVYGIHYEPTNPRYSAEGAPPLIVQPHRGPTSQKPAEFDQEVQFFTSRGYGVLFVNHRGSTGFGKEYMNEHAGTWGVVDVEDCLSGTQHLIDQGKADPDKLIIMGSSAGGYTVLQTLVNHPGVFKAGIVSYGVADLFALSMDTHKFESHYNDWLVGSLPDAADTYRKRSPVYHAQNIKDAMLVFQGTEDPVVPKSQSDAIVNALQRSGVPHEYHVYEGEGHGFRQPENIAHQFETIESFLLTHVIYA